MLRITRLLTVNVNKRVLLKYSGRRFATKSITNKKTPEKYDINRDPEFLHFYNESATELANELETSIYEFEEMHGERKEVIEKFPKVLEEWGWEITKSPIKNTKDDFIHISKTLTSTAIIDALIDYRVPENEGVREMQLLITNSERGLLYLIGTFDKTLGFITGSCYLLPASTSSLQLREDILGGSQECFFKLGSLYSKSTESDETELKEVTWLLQDSIKSNTMSELLGIREKFDILINDYIAEISALSSKRICENNESDVKFRKVVWLLIVYSELAARKNWLSKLKDFVK